MPLTPEAAELIEMMAASTQRRPAHEMSIQEYRESRKRAWVTTTASIYESRDVQIPTRGGSIAVRIYRPDSRRDLPVLMFIHGGGFATGDLDMHDNYLRILSSGANILIVSADYRLAPEHPYPAAFQDCVDAWDWIHADPPELSGDVSRVAIGGDSAGATLSWAVALYLRDTRRPLPAAILAAYGSGQMKVTNPEMATPMLTVEKAEWFHKMYMADPERQLRDPYCAPGVAASLKGLPPNLVITAEVDLIRDGCEEFARRLERDGVDVTLTRYEGVPHGFLPRVGILPEADLALAQTVKFLAEKIGAQPPQ
jgi:acetyl esterase